MNSCFTYHIPHPSLALIGAVVLVRRIHFVARDWKIQCLSLANSRLKIRLGFDLLGRSVLSLNVQGPITIVVDPPHYIMPFHDSDNKEGWSMMKIRLSGSPENRDTLSLATKCHKYQQISSSSTGARVRLRGLQGSHGEQNWAWEERKE